MNRSPRLDFRDSTDGSTELCVCKQYVAISPIVRIHGSRIQGVEMGAILTITPTELLAKILLLSPQPYALLAWRF